MLCARVLHKTLNLVISRCFAEDGKGLYNNVHVGKTLRFVAFSLSSLSSLLKIGTLSRGDDDATDTWLAISYSTWLAISYSIGRFAADNIEI